MLDAARAAGTDSPILFVFIPRQSADDLRRLIVEADATQQTLDFKGNPTGRGRNRSAAEHGQPSCSRS